MLNLITALFSIIAAFSAMLTTELIKDAVSQLDVVFLVVFICASICILFLFAHMIARSFISLFFPRERLLSGFVSDIAGFIVLNMTEASQQTKVSNFLEKDSQGRSL